MILARLARFEVEEKANELRWEACQQINARASEKLPSVGITVNEMATSGSNSQRCLLDYVTEVASGQAGGALEIEIFALHLGLSVNIYTRANGFYQRVNTLGGLKAENDGNTRNGRKLKEIFLLMQPGEYYDAIIIE